MHLHVLQKINSTYNGHAPQEKHALAIQQKNAHNSHPASSNIHYLGYTPQLNHANNKTEVKVQAIVIVSLTDRPQHKTNATPATHA